MPLLQAQGMHFDTLRADNLANTAFVLSLTLLRLSKGWKHSSRPARVAPARP